MFVENEFKHYCIIVQLYYYFGIIFVFEENFDDLDEQNWKIVEATLRCDTTAVADGHFYVGLAIYL